MLFRELRAILLRWPAREASLRPLRASFPERLPEYRDSAGGLPREWAALRVEGPSSACLLELGLTFVDLNERIVRIHWFCGFVEQGQSVRVRILHREGGLHGCPKAAQTAESMVHG